jgi:hypothetical protein
MSSSVGSIRGNGAPIPARRQQIVAELASDSERTSVGKPTSGMMYRTVVPAPSPLIPDLGA